MVGAGRSEEVVQKFLQLKDKLICVRGNREKYIIEGMPTIVHDEKVKVSQEQLDRNEWIKSHLSNISKKFINRPKKRKSTQKIEHGKSPRKPNK